VLSTTSLGELAGAQSAFDETVDDPAGSL
jgi:hypothetical protein